MNRTIPFVQTALLYLLLFASAAQAAVTSGGIVNVASYSRVGLPNSKIAQGSLFVVFGSNLGPANLVSANTFPLGTALGGTSIDVTVGNTTVNCPMIFTVSGQVAAILPSHTPVGMGQLKLTYNGQTFTEQVEVGKSSFGIFTQNAQGVGPAVVQNFEQGPVPGNESAGPLGPAAPNVAVKVYVGGVLSPHVFYAGRSGCCAGQDQVIFRIPAGVTGCYVSVMVLADGIPSNYATIAISPPGANVCSDPNGLSSEELLSFLSKDTVRFGSITLTRSVTNISINAPSLDVETKADSATAVFQSYVPQGLLSSTAPFQSSTINGCTVFQFAGTDTSPARASLIPPTSLDAGSLSITGPQGMKPIPALSSGFYFAILASVTTGLPGVPPGDPPFLDPGLYTVRGTGGADVGPFEAARILPDLLV